jgi:hypothetical protein
VYIARLTFVDDYVFMSLKPIIPARQHHVIKITRNAKYYQGVRVVQ